MPLYEYECGSCGVRFERLQRFSDAPLSVCPECGSDSVRRLITPPGIVFKGSGWYITDSRSKSSTTLPTKPTETKTPDTATEKASAPSEPSTRAADAE